MKNLLDSKQESLAVNFMGRQSSLILAIVIVQGLPQSARFFVTTDSPDPSTSRFISSDFGNLITTGSNSPYIIHRDHIWRLGSALKIFHLNHQLNFSIFYMN